MQTQWGYCFLDVMDANAGQEWTTRDVEEFKALFVETPNENLSDKMLGKRFPLNSMQQLSGQDHFDALGDMLCREIDVDPSINDATSDSFDWSKLVGGGTHDSVLDPSVEIPLNQPSKQLAVEVAGDQVAVQKSRPRRKSTLKKRRVWSSEEHRQFLYGMQRFGRGEWKAISTYYVPSRTPAQLASHAQKYFKRIEKDNLFDSRRRYIINDTKVVSYDPNIPVKKSYDPNNTRLSDFEPVKPKPTGSSIPQPMPTADMDDLTFLNDMNFLDDLVEGMPTFGQTNNNATNIARHMPLNNDILGNLQHEALSTCLAKDQGSVLIDQEGRLGAETRTCPFYRQNLGTPNQIHKKDIVHPSVLTAQTLPQVPPYGQRGHNPTYFPSVMAPSNKYNVHPTMPLPF